MRRREPRKIPRARRSLVPCTVSKTIIIAPANSNMLRLRPTLYGAQDARPLVAPTPVQDLRFRANDLRADAKLAARPGRAQAAGAGRDRARSWSIRGSKARRKHGIAIVVVPLALSADPQCRARPHLSARLIARDGPPLDRWRVGQSSTTATSIRLTGPTAAAA